MAKNTETKIKTIDLFAGCGGLTEGFEKEGHFTTAAAVEWIKPFGESLANRLKSKWHIKDAERRVLLFDIQRTYELIKGWNNDPTYGSHDGLADLIDHHVDLIIGGPPCQAYSVAGRIRDEHGMKYDYRNYLFESYLKVVRYFKPKMFLFENVPGMLSAKPGGISIIERIKKLFLDSGYEIIDDIKRFAVFNVADYGVPQFRNRVILLGLDKKSCEGNAQDMLRDFYSNIIPAYKAKKMMTVKQAIGDLPPFYPMKNPDDKKKEITLPRLIRY